MSLRLSQSDQAQLSGERDPANRMAMSIIVRIVEVRGAASLMNISAAHIDSTVYQGEGTLELEGAVDPRPDIKDVMFHNMAGRRSGVEER